MLPVLVYTGAAAPALTSSCPAVPGPTNPVVLGADWYIICPAVPFNIFVAVMPPDALAAAAMDVAKVEVVTTGDPDIVIADPEDLTDAEPIYSVPLVR